MPKPPNEGKICEILDLKRMTKKQEIQLFNDRRIRTIWDDKEEKWYFSVVDVIEALIDSPDPSTYWRVLKNRLKKEGNETVTICNAFKLPAKDGKMRLTPIADQEQLFRLIQSIPSPKAEPFKIWMASVASERLDEMQDPELTIERAMTDYRHLSSGWIFTPWRLLQLLLCLLWLWLSYRWHRLSIAPAVPERGRRSNRLLSSRIHL